MLIDNKQHTSVPNQSSISTTNDIATKIGNRYKSVSSIEIEEDREKIDSSDNIQEAVHTTFPKKPYLLEPASEHNGNQLPGAVMAESKTFEGDIPDDKEKKRDVNQLPGAIGSEGAFDEHKVDMFDAAETLKINEEVSKKQEHSENKEMGPNEVGDGVKKRKRRKKKKKKKLEKREESSDSTSEEKTNEKEGKGDDNKGEKSKEKETETEENKERSNESKKESETDSITEGKKSTSTDKAHKESKENSETKEKASTSSSKENVIQSPGPIYTGPHPMNRQMTELQVPGDGEELTETVVKEHYLKLVKAYLAPFADGIPRKSFFEILSRRTYSLAPPGSNKGVQTLLFQLHDKKLYLLDPYDIMKNSKPFYKTRIQELIWLLSDIAKEGTIPDTEFLVAIHDCVQTVNQDHEYRGSIFKESSPTFTIVSCNFSDNIPFPMWEGDTVRGGLKSWDEKMKTYRAMDQTEWEKKEAKAVFRGGNRPSMYFKTKKEANEHCDHAGRTAIGYLAETSPDLFNVGIKGSCGTKVYSMEHLSESEHHKFKYIMYAEGNCFWADRLNKQIFGPSAVIKQETPCGQFWEPLLKPMSHYIPTDFFFSDTVQQIQWARDNDEKVMSIVSNANQFADAFLSFKGIKTYVEVLLLEYTKLLKVSTITPEKGSSDVTV